VAEKEFFFILRYDEWSLATAFEIMASRLSQGKEVKCFDWTQRFQIRFEFPLAERIYNRSMRKRIKRSNLPRNLDNLGKPGSFQYTNNPRVFRRLEIDNLADEVAYLELISVLRESAPIKEHHTKALFDYKKTFNLTYSAALSELLIERPKKVFIYNGRFLQERAVWEACRSLSIPVVFYEKINPNWVDKYFLFEQPTHSPMYRSEIMNDFGDEMLTSHPSEFTSIGSKWFEDRTLGKTQEFTKHQKQGLNLNISRPYYIFFHSSEDELITTDLISTIWGHQHNALAMLVEAMGMIGNYDLVIRMHPNLLHKSRREIQFWKKIGFELSTDMPWIHFVPSESEISSYALIKEAEGVITVGSTIGVEAAFMNKKSILLGRAFHEQMNITRNPANIEELVRMIERPLSSAEIENSRLNSLKYATFHSAGGNHFEWVKFESGLKRSKYTVKSLKIQRSLIISLLMRIEFRSTRFKIFVSSFFNFRRK
jgi:hypothetical protein